MVIGKRNMKLALATGFASFAAFAAGPSYYHGSIGALSNQLMGGVGDVDGNRRNADIEFSYHNNRPYQYERKFSFAVLNNDQNKSMFSVQEAYVSNKWGRSEVHVGRQVLHWADVDSVWGFGKLNNRKNFTGFDPGQEGLTGLNFNRHYKNGFNYDLFGSFLYVPEMNPSLDIDKSNGTITSSNPWANAPAASARVAGQDVPIFYNVNYPKYNEVVYRYTAGAKAGWSNKHWNFDGFIVRKPENQISTSVDVSFNPGDKQITAYVQPQFYYHDVYGSSLSYKNKDVKMYVSGMSIRPNEYPDGNALAAQYTQLKPEKRKEDYVGGGITKENDRIGLGLNYVARLSPFNREGDVLAQDPRWNQAVNLHGRYSLNRYWTVIGDLKYDMLTTDRLAMWRANYMASRSMMMTVGVNMIGAPANGKSYWSPYRNNDAVFAGLRYVF